MKPADARQCLARAGEREAERALRRSGMRILERRLRLLGGEIDLVAECGELVVFIEVKTRRGVGYGRPAEAVTRVKRRRLARTALAYLQRRSWISRPTRFDVVEVLAGPDGIGEVRHIADAFRIWPTG